MYGGYQGGYDAYGNPQYGVAGQHGQQQHQQQQQSQYQGVNPYADYGYGSATAVLPPPPPPPPLPEQQYSTYPTTVTTTTTKSTFYAPGQSYNPNPNPNYSNSQQYQGYDSAVHNYAQHSKNAPKTPWNRHYRQGSGDNKEYYCDVCKVSCAGGITYKEHLAGKAHKKREESEKMGKPQTHLARNKLSYRCDLCNITCTGEDTYLAHVRGGKHQKTANLHKKMGKYVPEDVPTIIAPGEDGPIETKAKPKWHQQAIPGTKKVIGINTVQFVGGHVLNSTGQIEEKKREVARAVSSVGRPSFPKDPPEIEVEDERVREMMEKEKVEPVGADYVDEERDATGKLIQFHCRICDCSFSDPNAKDVHVKGRRHRQSYKTKIDPTISISPKPSKNKNKNRQHVTSSESPPESSFGSTMNRVQWFTRSHDIVAQNSAIIDERTLEKKYESLFPGMDHCQNTESFVKEVEAIFGSVANRTMQTPEPSEAQNPSEDVTTKTSENSGKPLLTGLRRLGVYAKNTYLREDDCVEMWLHMTSEPSSEKLKKIVEVFKEVDTTNLSIEMDPNSAISFIVRHPNFAEPYLRIACTSPQFQNKEELEKSTFPEKMACAEVYRQNRRCEWYTCHGEYLNSCKQVVRLFRDARSRHAIWTVLEDYKLELIIHNIISSTSCTLRPLEAFKRVLEAFSSGYLFNAFLLDPCEPTLKTNVLDSITEEQKHDLTSSAQNFLRQIAFNQIHEVLGIDRLDEFSQPPQQPESSSLKRAFDDESLQNPEDVGGNSEDVGDEEDENPEDVGDSGEPDAKRGRLEEEVEDGGPGAEPKMEVELEPEGTEPMDGTI